MAVTLIKVEAPKRLDSFIEKEMKCSYPEFRAHFDLKLQQAMDLLRRGSALLEGFLDSSSKRSEQSLRLLAEAKVSLGLATEILLEIKGTPEDLSEEEEERVCCECGGRNGSRARELVDDVFQGIVYNGGRVSSAVVGNAYAAWYRVTREQRRLENLNEV